MDSWGQAGLRELALTHDSRVQLRQPETLVPLLAPASSTADGEEAELLYSRFRSRKRRTEGGSRRGYDLLILYEQRLNRSLQKNLAVLQSLQAARKAQRETEMKVRPGQPEQPRSKVMDQGVPNEKFCEPPALSFRDASKCARGGGRAALSHHPERDESRAGVFHSRRPSPVSAVDPGESARGRTTALTIIGRPENTPGLWGRLVLDVADW